MEPGSVFALAQKLLAIPQAKAAAVSVLAWIGSKVFNGKEKTQEELKQLERQEADAVTLAALQSKLDFALENNDALRQELESKVAELQQFLKQAEQTGPVTASGAGAKVYQNIEHSAIIDNSVSINSGK